MTGHKGASISGPLAGFGGVAVIAESKTEFPGLSWEFGAGLWKIAPIILGRVGDYDKCTTSTIWLLF